MITVRDDPNITSAVTLARHYYYIDDAIQDAMRLVAALAQSGARAQLPDAAAVIVSQKRRLGTDRWGAGDEAAFWAAFAELATVAKEHGLLRRPSPRISRSGRSWWRLKRIAAYRALLIIFVIVLALAWSWAKTFAEAINSDRALLTTCLTSEAAVAPARTSDRVDGPSAGERVAACKHVAFALESKLGWAENVVARLLLGSGISGSPCPPCEELRDIALKESQGERLHLALVLFADHTPIADALGQIIKAFAVFVLPPWLGALGAWCFILRRKIRNPDEDMTPSRVGNWHTLLNVLLGATLGAIIGYWTTERGPNVDFLQSLPPLIAAFIAGYGRDAVFAWVDDLVERIRKASQAMAPESRPSPMLAAQHPLAPGDRGTKPLAAE